ncbi:MAG: chemotaxis protein CheW [Planctomycetes bacterium]|nr:chemotaxis protein CheW [Planctomycetota bacterium]
MAEDTQALTLSETEMQLVVFDLASEYYGVDIGAVREIIRMQGITRVPGAESFVEGLINLRGRVVPVVDLRKRLNLAVGEQTKDSRIVVVDIAGQDVGVVVDGVTEVLRIPLSSIEPPSSMVTSVESDYLRGIAKLETKLIILLDLDKVFSAIERQAISSIGVAAKEPPSTAEVEEETEPVSGRGKKKKKALVASTH